MGQQQKASTDGAAHAEDGSPSPKGRESKLPWFDPEAGKQPAVVAGSNWQPNLHCVDHLPTSEDAVMQQSYVADGPGGAHADARSAVQACAAGRTSERFSDGTEKTVTAPLQPGTPQNQYCRNYSGASTSAIDCDTGASLLSSSPIACELDADLEEPTAVRGQLLQASLLARLGHMRGCSRAEGLVLLTHCGTTTSNVGVLGGPGPVHDSVRYDLQLGEDVQLVTQQPAGLGDSSQQGGDAALHHRLLGQGYTGRVMLGSMHGKMVAVKLLHPCMVQALVQQQKLLDKSGQQQAQGQDEQQLAQRHRPWSEIQPQSTTASLDCCPSTQVCSTTTSSPTAASAVEPSARSQAEACLVGGNMYSLVKGTVVTLGYECMLL